MGIVMATGWPADVRLSTVIPKNQSVASVTTTGDTTLGSALAYDQARLERVTNSLDARPRKAFDFATSSEKFSAMLTLDSKIMSA
jgi:hypothetical protein